MFPHQEMTTPPSSHQSPRVNFDENKSSQQNEKEENDNNPGHREKIKGENGKLLTNNNVDGELSSDCSHPASGRNMNILRFKALLCKSSNHFHFIILNVVTQNINFTVYPGCIRIKSRILPKLRLGRR